MKCSQCGNDDVRRLCAYLGSLWCLTCRREHVDAQPPLPEVRKVRREFAVEIAGKTYRFNTKSEARNTARAILKVKRLPSDITELIDGSNVHD